MSKTKDPKFGKRAQDRVTGFQGIITGRCEYLYGCTQYCIVPDVDKDGQMKEGHWFDEGRVELIEGRSVKPADVQVEENGADYNAPRVHNGRSSQ